MILHRPLIALSLDAGPTLGTKGIIAGVLQTEELTTAIQNVAGAINPSFCSGPNRDSIVMQVTQASDITQNGTQDPTPVCDGITIGVGFDSELVTFGSVQTRPLPSDPCAAGGTGG